jgi:hypothetical protein
MRLAEALALWAEQAMEKLILRIQAALNLGVII